MSYCTKLSRLRNISLRRGIWYKVLNVLERAQVDLTLHIVKKIRSRRLAKVLDVIIEKISSALQSRISQIVESVGIPMAHRLSRLACNWGNKSAHRWSHDLKFVRYLAVMNLNSQAQI